MIHRTHGDITFECDSCGETLETNEDYWSNAWQLAKDEGWTSRKVGNEWNHFCLDCER